ncbi:hypothetical protein KIH87_12725 [Paraneptunicella aestuarii]|uniref:polymorphic toxin type 46 domain-containing protein n=1 Tax=Paraneptunicella aestuarii TaxID=2831148 RepID=UPI001E516675|nr:polymorphic toxin type 46 domain-containing protein [Paraneptunicella aestuarii]UAA37573.1 hypothetical protein KIH87_12725 [Paraneptunicella aestuarii]
MAGATFAALGTGNIGKLDINFQQRLITERKGLATSFYQESGYSIEATADHLKGIDFKAPVDVVTLNPGTDLIQFQIPEAPMGNYFALPGTPGNTLGFYTSGRVATNYVTTSDVKALRSTAASTIDHWSMKSYDWKIDAPGGGMQFFTTSKSFRGN